MCVASEPNCPFKKYQIKKLDWLKNQLSEAVVLFTELKKTMNSSNYIVYGTELIGQISNIQELINKVNITSSGVTPMSSTR
jgi:hypothetical protein